MEAYYNYSINNNGRLEHYGNKPSDYSTTVLTKKAINFIPGHATRSSSTSLRSPPPGDPGQA